jgi:hypothetical protein
VLQVSVREVRRRVRSGDLVDASLDGRVRVCAHALALVVRSQIEAGAAGPLTALLLDDVVGGRLRLPMLSSDRARPPSVVDLLGFGSPAAAGRGDTNA